MHVQVSCVFGNSPFRTSQVVEKWRFSSNKPSVIFSTLVTETESSGALMVRMVMCRRSIVSAMHAEVKRAFMIDRANGVEFPFIFSLA